MAQPVSSSRLVVGLDAGASKTLLFAQRPGSEERIERRGPGANPNRIGRMEAANVLSTLVKDLLQEMPNGEHVSLCAGIAGAGRPEEQRILAEVLRADLGSLSSSVRVEVVHDALIALDAAYDTGSGLIVIAGTGSVVLGRTTDNTLFRSGGWGHVLGDAGSGYAIGRAGLQAIAEAFDGGDDTALRTLIRNQLGIDDRDSLLHKVYQDEFGVQTVAPLVVDAAANGDAVASELLASQVSQLAEQVGWLLNRATEMASRITLLGGMLQNDLYEQCLRRRLQDRFPNWTVEVLQEEPVVGALRRAKRLQADVSE